MTRTYVLDTSAWFALIENEDGADVVEGLLRQAEEGGARVLVSFMTFMELEYITLQERGDAEAAERVRLMSETPATRIESTVAVASLAAKLKAGHNISVADAWIAALAQREAATLVHKDPEYEQIKSVIDTLKLPYKSELSKSEVSASELDDGPVKSGAPESQV